MDAHARSLLAAVLLVPLVGCSLLSGDKSDDDDDDDGGADDTAAADSGGVDSGTDTDADTDTDTDTDTDADADTDADTDVDTDADTDTDTDTADGWTITGTAVDLISQTTVADGTCVRLFDPTPVLSGGEPLVLGETTTSGGAYRIEGVSTTSTLGLTIGVENCAGGASGVYPTQTGLLVSDYADLGDGDTLSGETAFSLSRAFMASVDTSALIVGYGGTVSEDGLLLGIVEDRGGAPVSGATVVCAGCAHYYFDADGTDGLFSSSSGANTSTAAAAGGMFAVPAAPITAYAVDDGGSHTWSSLVLGSSQGVALVASFTAQ